MPGLRKTPRPIYLPNCPRFVFGTTDLKLSLPSMPLDYEFPVVGGDIEADSGMRASFVVRRDELWSIVLRFYESEWPNVQAFIDYGQTAQLFRYYPDTLNPAVSYQVRLIVPAINTKYQTREDAQYGVVLTLPITLFAHAVVAPAESGSDLPAGLVFDYDADDAVTIDTNGVIPVPGGYGAPRVDGIWHAALYVPSRLEGGPSLIVESNRPAYYNTEPTELNHHGFLRAFGSSNNHPMFAELAAPVDAPDGVTLWAVHRPGAEVTHGMPFELGDDTTRFAGIGQLIAFGIVSGEQTMGGWHRGGPFVELGEFGGSSWGGQFFFQPENWPYCGYYGGTGNVFGTSDDYQEGGPVTDAGNRPASASRHPFPGNVKPGPFNITFMRLSALGIVSMFVNGVKMPYSFTSPPEAYKVQKLLVTSSAGGSLDLGGGQCWEWTRVGAYARALADVEIKQATRVLGQRYHIAVA